jgi:predicted Zn-dependent protease
MHRPNWIVRPLASLAVVCLLAAAGGGCAVTDKTVIPQARQFHTTLEPAVIEPTNDKVLAGYLQTVGDRIIAAAADYNRRRGGTKENRAEDSRWMFEPGGMKFLFVNSKTLNAFTTGGEFMYIYTELFRQCRNEDELAAVMAHEFAHVYARHVHSGMKRQQWLAGGTVAASLVGAAAGGDSIASYAGGLTGAALGLAGMKFTRNDENEADKLGFIFYVRAGWDPDQFAGFFQTMIDKGMDTTPEMMSDHPSLKNRVAATKDRASRLPPESREWRRAPVASVTEFRRLQDRAADVGRTMPNDTSLAQTQELLAAVSRSCLTPRDNTSLPDQRVAQQRVVTDLEAAERRNDARR